MSDIMNCKLLIKVHNILYLVRPSDLKLAHISSNKTYTNRETGYTEYNVIYNQLQMIIRSSKSGSRIQPARP